MAIDHITNLTTDEVRGVMMGKLVVYARVSTEHQGANGLGIAAQLNDLRRFAKAGEHEIIKPEFVEVQSGADDDRPVLAQAVKSARLYGAALCVAKMDRLTRTGETVKAFERRCGVKIIALDNLSGDDVQATVGAFVGNMERALISRRTKAALQALKASGKALGGYRGVPPKDYAQKLGAASVKARAASRAGDVAEVIAEIDPAGEMSLASIANALNARGVATARGGQWSATQVMRVKARA
jgi:DNA invertase Pin-like site-specific DNA recombinase